MTIKSILIATLGVLWLSVPALAHSPIIKSSIEAGATYKTSPESFDFSFSKAVGLAKVRLTTMNGDDISLDFDKPKSMEKSFSVPLPELSDGHYTIEWSAVASDGHVMTGSIPFMVGAMQMDHSDMDHSKHSDHKPSHKGH